MVLGDAILKPKLVEQLALVPPLPTHHRPVLRRRSRQADGITVRCHSQRLYRQHPAPNRVRPLRADAVDKGGDEQRTGNNRIQVPSFLNRYCAPDSYLDSMLLTRLSKNVYRQHLPTVDVAAKAQSHTING